MSKLSELIRNKTTDRQVRLRSFLVSRGVKVKALAEARGLSPGAMGDVLSGRRPKREHIDWLREQGIPDDLLPTPADPQRRGRKPTKSAD
ncbi:hypothetical protein [Desulfovibrio inopinatus]|uniref:hypothetical protein n=1 Tax=Desulfovibrio inopinatus TaxID=102109 RepID=UPI00041465E4|nr:hypothetical protein [Desulfovibrio inopinatus]